VRFFFLKYLVPENFRLYRRAAKDSLACYGVCSKDTLKIAMINVGLIPPEGYTRGTWLDSQMVRMKQDMEDQITRTNNIIQRWRSGIDSKIYGSPFPRPGSMQTTLFLREPVLVINGNTNATFVVGEELNRVRFLPPIMNPNLHK
jgi:hypothetical protein